MFVIHTSTKEFRDQSRGANEKPIKIEVRRFIGDLRWLRERKSTKASTVIMYIILVLTVNFEKIWRILLMKLDKERL